MVVLSAKIGEIKVGRAPDILEAIALGSCVAVFLYDDINKVGACAHVLLPTSSKYGLKSMKKNSKGKFADIAIPETIKLVVTKGGKRERLKAKIVGGARMFEVSTQNSKVLDIGARNIEAVKKHLSENNIPIVADDTGSNYGRTVTFDLETFVLDIKIGLKRQSRHL